MEEKKNKKEFPAFLAAIGIPLLWVILYAFSRRKRSICIQQYGIDECKPSRISYIFLCFAICIALYGIIKIRNGKEKEEEKKEEKPKEEEKEKAE
ncbi:hypothetical protein GPJ56_000554 [Histomonas meleagridis]|uniref:uncharacterized protein n=1 Tax=Histomonas meleagridis TaxID=135588 RepID=UPI003559E7EC|nr:hypothetical protein GPJ56_000554 [Histomonas meleagridis]KAH0796406.1 hypothetical protein GO595_010299 [Histomonas meleagridis]